MQEFEKEIVKNLKVVAVVGCSEKAYRTSHHIARYLQEQGIRIIPINPSYDTIFGEPCYDTLLDIPDDIRIDVVDIFRSASYCAEMVAQVVSFSEKTGQEPLIWTQLDVSSPEAQQKAADAQLPYVKNKCLMVEHQRLT